MNKGRKDRNMMIMLCITAVVGATNILINGNFVFLLPYLLLMAISVPTLYFNYSLCKWENKWHSCWNERTPYNRSDIGFDSCDIKFEKKEKT